MSLIVIVDDRSTNRTIYSKLALSIGEGVKVRAFAEPAEALKWLERNRPDLIVTDYDMPQMDGEEFISRFRGLPQSVGVPIMMITVNDQRKLRLRALESGATDFLNTPIDHCEFLMRARNLLKLSHDAARAEESRLQVAKRAPETGEVATARPIPEADRTADVKAFLTQGADAGAYAMHVVALDRSGDAEAIAGLLRRQLREGDVLARIADDRFALLQRKVLAPAEAAACARRLSGLCAPPLHVGTALPQADGLAPTAAAAACLEAATGLALRRAAPGVPDDDGASVRFLPRIDLNSGAVVGAQILYRGAPAEAGDFKALHAALGCIASLRFPQRHEARFSLRLALSAGAIPFALRLAPQLTEARVAPSRLDLQICAREALVEPARAQSEARAARALGMSITLDLAALGPQDLRARDQWAALLAAFIDAWRPALKFPCGDRRAVAVARLLRAVVARRAGCAPTLLADGVPSPDRLAPLRKAGVSLAQGACFGGAFRPGDLRALLIAQSRAHATRPSSASTSARRA